MIINSDNKKKSITSNLQFTEAGCNPDVDTPQSSVISVHFPERNQIITSPIFWCCFVQPQICRYLCFHICFMFGATLLFAPPF